MCGFGNETPPPALVATVSLGLGSIDIDQAVSATTDITEAKMTIVRMTPTSIVSKPPQ